MPRDRDRADSARRRVKRAGGLLREAAADLAALADPDPDGLAELDLEHTGDLPRAAELLELMLAQYGPVHLTVQRAAHPHHGAREARRSTPA